MSIKKDRMPLDEVREVMRLLHYSIHTERTYCDWIKILAKMPGLANFLNTDLLKGFTVPQVAEKHGWPEPMVWSIALEGKTDLERFKELNWGFSEHCRHG